MVNVLPEFDILEHLNKLEIVKELPREYHCKCPVCGDGGFKIDKLSGKYNAFKCGCPPAKIREAIAPIKAAFEANAPQKSVRPAQTRRWEYRSWSGVRLAAVKRIDDGQGNKEIRQGHWTGTEYKNGFPAEKRAEVALYRWTEVQAAIANGAPFVFWVEGEGVADVLWEVASVPATTSIGGCKGYESYGQYEGALSGTQVVICPDMDASGVEYARKVARDNPGAMWLYAFPKDSRWGALEKGKGLDVEDWINAGATREDIFAAIEPRERGEDHYKVQELREAVRRLVEETDPFARSLQVKNIGSEFGVRGQTLDELERLSNKTEARNISLSDALCDTFNEIERRAAGELPLGIPTGFYDLDAMIQGYQPGDFIVLGARPGQGKTSKLLANAIAAAQAGKQVYFFSLEMSMKQLTQRMISSLSSIESSRLRLGRINDNEWDKLGGVIAALSDLSINLNHTPGLTVDGIEDQIKEGSKPDIIFIDYLTLLDGPGQNDVARYTQVSKKLKRLALKLDIPVVAAAQLSRGVENRTNKRPLMSDLRETGQIEQDADLIMMLYREEYYDPETPDKGIAEVLVVKHRNGPTGTIKLLFEPEFTRFRNLGRQ